MKNLCAAAALWIGLSGAGPALAASTVTLTFQLESGSAFDSTAVWGLYVQNSLGIALGAVDVLVEGATGFTFNPSLPGISLADSVYSVRPVSGYPWDALIINNTASGVTLVPAGGTARMGSFAGSVPVLVPGETPDPTGPGTVLGGTIFDVNLNVITASGFDRTPYYCDPGGCFGPSGLTITVPEPFAPVSALAPALLVALVFMRRLTSCA